MAGRLVKTVFIRRRDKTAIKCDNYKGELCENTKPLKVARVFESEYGLALVFDEKFGLMLPGTGEVLMCDQLWIDIKDPLPPRENYTPPGAPQTKSDDNIPF
jgi:hypothetical protein